MSVELSFGTSGLRDTVENMTDRECYINTCGFIEFLKEKKELSMDDPSIALGGDLRSSTPRIMAAVSRAILDSGCGVISCGAVPSPALALYSVKKGLPGIMVTGSHIPEDRNGIKFTKLSGEVLKSDEEDILRNVAVARKIIGDDPEKNSLFDAKGAFRECVAPPSPLANDEACSTYIKRYTDVFPKDSLNGMKVVLYQHSAVGRDMLKDILEFLGVEVICVGRSDKFIPVDTEKISVTTRELLEEWAGKYDPFAIVSTDGDSDRPLFADEKGFFIPGDKLGALVSMYLNPDFAAVPVSANDAVISVLKDNGVSVAQTKIGSPFVIRAMMDHVSSFPASKVVSWESNGGFLLGSDWNIGGKVLESLSTRDAVLPILIMLFLTSEKGLSVSQVVSKFLPPRFTDAGVVDNLTLGCEKYTAGIGKRIVGYFTPCSSEENEISFEGAVPSPGKSEVSDDCRDGSIEIKKRLERFFSKDKGFDSVRSVNFTDGIKVRFSNEDVVHLRPSGNAPEFRIYATASTPERASQIVSFKDIVVPAIMEDLLDTPDGGIGHQQSHKDPLLKGALLLVKNGTPFFIEPYEEKKVWGINGIGEFWYGPGTDEKGALAILDGSKYSMKSIMDADPEKLLGKKVIEKFGLMAPLVKILTPKGRLSVQFHDSKNELWVVTSCDASIAGGKNWVILGFSSDAIQKYGENVAEEYGKALAVYGQKLNELMDLIEKDIPGGEEILEEEGDILKASTLVMSEHRSEMLSEMESGLLNARENIEFFYFYREVEPGDVIPVPSGTLHALGPGVSVIEPQIPGPTQSLEDGTTYPIRYYFPGYERPGALRMLDVDRVGEMRAEITKDSPSEILEKNEHRVIERLPGNFAEKGLESRRITFKGVQEETVFENDCMHIMVATRGKVHLKWENGEIEVPLAFPGGPMLVVPASLKRYTFRSEGDTQILDTFSPV